ncbi:hypothetical protein BS47DRAFT_1308978, partial [Hydnum rufescens UP504]
WNTSVLPSLVHPYMAFCVATNSRHGPVQSTTEAMPCGCRDHSVQLEVICVYLKCLDLIILFVCTCRPAPQQFIQQGLFPCAPVFPKLAIELDMLELAAGLFFVNALPNETAWAATLMEFLNTWGYVFATGVSI